MILVEVSWTIVDTATIQLFILVATDKNKTKIPSGRKVENRKVEKHTNETRHKITPKKFDHKRIPPERPIPPMPSS